MFTRKKWQVFSLPLAIILGMTSGLGADPCFHCQWHHCPPHHRHCLQKPPKIKFKCGCPLPVCCPCDRPNWGYYQPCWVPWPWPPDWSHCPLPPPAAFVVPMPRPAPGTQGGPPLSSPQPRFDVRPGL